MRINGVGENKWGRIKFTIPPTPFILLLVLSCHAGASQSTTPGGFWTSDRFQVSFESELKPIVINQIHQWIIQVQTLDGVTCNQSRNLYRWWYA